MERVKEFTEIVERIAKETGVNLPTGLNYRYAPYDCWKCGKEMVVFKWCHGRIEGEIEKPPEPIPKTIKERYTSTSDETYWANVCPHCDNVQGDWFLSVEPDSPFFTLHDIEDTKESFESDIAGIAEYYFSQLVAGPVMAEGKQDVDEEDPTQKRLWS